MTDPPPQPDRIPELYELEDDGHGGHRVVLHPHAAQVRVLYSTARITAMVAGSQSGKLEALSNDVVTPVGVRKFGDLMVGDDVFAEDGTPTRITYITPTVDDHPTFDVEFDSGHVVRCGRDHGWLVQTYRDRKNAARRRKLSPGEWRGHNRGPLERVLTTGEMVEAGVMVRVGGRLRSQFAVNAASPLRLPDAELPIPPYTLGAWLGDGASDAASITTMDTPVLDRITQEGFRIGRRRSNGAANRAGLYTIHGLSGLLRAEGLLGNKHIPECYLFGSFDQRLALVQGLMDSDGHRCKKPMAGRGRYVSTNSCEWVTVRKPMADQMLRLLASLGIKAKCVSKKTAARDAYRVTFSTDLEVFSLPRQMATGEEGPLRADCRAHFIVDIRPVPPVPMRCIAVDHPRRLYLSGLGLIPTHNTAWGPWWLHSRIAGLDVPELDFHLPPLGPGVYLAVSPNYDLVKQKLIPELLTVFEHVLRIGRWWAADRVLELRTPPKLPDGGWDYANWAEGTFQGSGSSSPNSWGRVVIRSAKAKGGLESMTGLAAWLDEAGQEDFTIKTWEAVLRRLSLSRGPILITTTPYIAGGWLKTEIVDAALKGDSDVNVIRAASIINPRFSREEFEDRRRKMHPARFQMMYEGKLTAPVGQVYPDFDASRTTIDPLRQRLALQREGWVYVGGIDFGWSAPTAAVVLARAPDGNVFIVRSYAESEMLLEQHAEIMLRWERELPGGRRIAWYGDPSGAQHISELQQKGVYIVKADNAVLPGIDAVTELIRTNRLWLFGPHAALVASVEGYVFKVKDDEPTDAPLKVNDHAADALRYAALGLQHYVPAAGAGGRHGGDVGADPRSRALAATARTRSADVRERVLGKRGG